MALSFIKTGAVAVAVLALSVSGAFAANYGTLNFDTKVKKSWSSASATVNWAEAGDTVKILDYTGKNGGWFKVKVDGPDGWVKKSAIDIDMGGDDDDAKVKFCFYGPLGYVCAKS